MYGFFPYPPHFIFLMIYPCNNREVKIVVYGTPVTANVKSYFEINCKLFEVKTICALKLKNELTIDILYILDSASL